MKLEDTSLAPGPLYAAAASTTRFPLVLLVLLVAFAVPGPATNPVHPRSVVEPCAPVREQPVRKKGAEDRRRAVTAEPTSESGARCLSIAGRIRAVLDEPWMGDLPAHSEERLQGFLVDLLLDGGLPERALDALERRNASPDLWQRAGWRLEKGDQPALATRAYLEAARRAPDYRGYFYSLAEIDAAAGLALLDTGPAWFARLSTGPRVACCARLLVRCGRVHDALDAVHAALGEGDLGQEFWEYFLELEPERAREELERRARTGSDDSLSELYADALVAQADALVAQWEEDGATELLSAWVRAGGADDRVIERLAELDLLRALDSLGEHLARAPRQAGAWSQFGDLLLYQGRVDDGLDAWQRAFELDPEECYHYEELWMHRPERFLAAFETALVGSRDAWMWGTYGDYLWRSERTQDARDAWTTASHLDSEDSYWNERLERAQAGVWPLAYF